MKEYLAAYVSDSDTSDNDDEEAEIPASPHGLAAPEEHFSPCSEGDEVKSPASEVGLDGGVKFCDVDDIDVAVHEARLCDVACAPKYFRLV